MEEIIEFRFPDVWRHHLPPDYGEVGETGWVTVFARRGDDSFRIVENAHHGINLEYKGLAGIPFEIRRKYNRAELAEAKLFHMSFPAPPSLASKQIAYDWSGCCPVPLCSAGRKQVLPLQIRLDRLPRNKPILKTLGREWLVSKQLGELLLAQGFTGFRLEPVNNDDTSLSAEPTRCPLISQLPRYASGRELLRRAREVGVSLEHVGYHWLETTQEKLWEVCVAEHNDWLRLQGRKQHRKPVSDWFQIVVTSSPSPTCPPTAFGIGPFEPDEAGRYCCPNGPLGHLNGLHVLSEVFISKKALAPDDIVATANLFGLSNGYSVPEPMLLVSPRFRECILSSRPKGVVFEVAHIV